MPPKNTCVTRPTYCMFMTNCLFTCKHHPQCVFKFVIFFSYKKHFLSQNHGNVDTLLSSTGKRKRSLRCLSKGSRITDSMVRDVQIISGKRNKIAKKNETRRPIATLIAIPGSADNCYYVGNLFNPYINKYLT